MEGVEAVEVEKLYAFVRAFFGTHLTLFGYFCEVFPFLCNSWLETMMFSDDTNSVPNNYHYECSIFVCQRIAEQQSLHMSGFFYV